MQPDHSVERFTWLVRASHAAFMLGPVSTGVGKPVKPKALIDPHTSCPQRQTISSLTACTFTKQPICCAASAPLQRQRDSRRTSPLPLCTGLSSFQESVAIDRIQRIMGVLQNPCMGYVSKSHFIAPPSSLGNLFVKVHCFSILLNTIIWTDVDTHFIGVFIIKNAD